MNVVNVETFKTIVETERNNPKIDLINVCTPGEYKENHIEGVRNVPLDTLAERVGEFAGKERVYVHCRSGARAERAITQLKQLGVTAELINVQGGLVAWGEAGFPTNSLTSRLPIMRQVFITAGVFILLGVLLGATVSPWWNGLAAFVGAGLTFAGITGWCGMSFLLARMPWNR